MHWLTKLYFWWDAGARVGVRQMDDYPTRRRIMLVNQMAILGGLITLFYGIIAPLYAPFELWPLLAVSPLELAGYAAVVWLNGQRRDLLSRLLLVLVAGAQITFAAWMLSSRAGAQFYFFVLWAAVFLLYSRDERWLAVFAGGLWLVLFMWIQTRFDQAWASIDLESDFWAVTAVINVLGSFILLGCAIALFYREINRTEELLRDEYRRSDELLKNILPETVAERLKSGSRTVADGFDEVTLLFADIVGFTRLAESLSPEEVVKLLNSVFSRFDRLVESRGLEKIKTIGDEYMVAGGIPLARADHAQAVAEVALEMMHGLEQINHNLGRELTLRVGIHSGEVVAGVIGSHKFSYDVWGDTVNTASRMQSQSLPGRIQVTQAVYEKLQDSFTFKRRGTIRVRGKGRMETWFLLGRNTQEDA